MLLNHTVTVHDDAVTLLFAVFFCFLGETAVVTLLPDH